VEGYPPIVIEAKGLRGGEVEFREPPSSQFLSGLMMAAPYAANDTYIAVRGALPSRPYLDMTLAVMRALGVEVLENEGRFVVPAWQRYQAGTYTVEPDASAATYFWAAAAVTGGRVRVDGLTRSSRQGDVHFVDVLGQMGCQVSEEAGGLVVSAPQGQRLRGIDVDLNAMPDTVQTLAVAALFADGPTTIRNVANLRIKETDRIAALAAELAKLGARVDPCPDGLTIHPPDRAKLARIATYDDHRMAMSFAIAGLAAEGITIADAGCVSKSHPNYFEALGQLRAHYPR
jgi:3-phosphoshikimate 1-carboxyvinyltransferase